MLANSSSGKWSEVRALMKKGNRNFDVSFSSGKDRGANTLWYVANSNEWTLLGKMLNSGAKGYSASPLDSEHKLCGVTVFWLSIKSLDLTIVGKMLDNAGKYINQIPNNPNYINYGITPLWRAVYFRAWRIVNVMIEKYDNLDFDSYPLYLKHRYHGASVFWLAVEYKKWDLVNIMVQRGVRNFSSYPINVNNKEHVSIISKLANSEKDQIIFNCYSLGRFSDIEDADDNKKIAIVVNKFNDAFEFICAANLYSLNKNSTDSKYAGFAENIKEKISVKVLKERYKTLFEGWEDREILSSLKFYYDYNFAVKQHEYERKVIADTIFYKMKNAASLRSKDSSSNDILLLFSKGFVAHKKEQIKISIRQMQEKEELPSFLSLKMRQRITNELCTTNLSSNEIFGKLKNISS